MDSNTEPIVNELRRQNRLNIYSVIAVIVLIPATMFLTIYFVQLFTTDEKEEPTWCSIESEIRNGEFEDALAHAEKIMPRYVNDYERHIQIGKIYILNDKIEEAKEHFQSAVNILPTPENKNYLNATRERMESDNIQPKD